MHTNRIVPCLDVNNGRVVKGINFVDLIDAGDPVEQAEIYNKAGADELVFLDITASSDNRDTIVDVVRKTAEKVFIPLTVGGGIRTVEDFRKILTAGADKISINSSALKEPSLITKAAERFGNQCVVVAIDCKRRVDKNGNKEDGYDVYLNGGRVNTNKDCLEWAIEVEKLGAGEILLTSMDADGTKKGYDMDITKAVSEAVNIPVIASGGAGNMEDFYDVFTKTKVTAALAASLFHFKTLEIIDLKSYLREKGISVRI